MIASVTARRCSQADVWRELHKDEEGRLDWALGRAELPSRAHVFGQ